MTESLIPEEAQSKLAPESVTPAALFLVSEDAPNGVIMQAEGGRFSVASIVENAGTQIGVDATPEDIASNFEMISDLTGAKPKGMMQINLS